MLNEISLENFNYTNRDRYRKIRIGDRNIVFSYLINYVVADMDRRVLAIEVDDHFLSMRAKLDSLYPDVVAGEGEPPYLPCAGTMVENPIGEQLIAFCEADLKQYLQVIFALLELRDAAAGNTPASEEIREQFNIKKAAPVVKKPATHEDLQLIYYENYETLMTVADSIVNACFYTSIFPPLIFSFSAKAFKTYCNYLFALQEEYRRLLDFCFSVDFYAEALEGLTAASRFSLYCGATDANPMRALNMSF